MTLGNQDKPWAPSNVCKMYRNPSFVDPRKSESNEVRCAYALARATEPQRRFQNDG